MILYSSIFVSILFYICYSSIPVKCSKDFRGNNVMLCIIFFFFFFGEATQISHICLHTQIFIHVCTYSYTSETKFIIYFKCR